MPYLLPLVLLISLAWPPSFAAAATVVINEFQSSNGATIADEDGDFEDWIELYNHGDEPVLLGGYGLSDDEDRPFRWVLPDIALGPGEFLLVFASNKDRLNGPFLHTNFAISSDGEELLLTAPNGTLLDFVPPTAVARDLSLGRQPDGTGDWFFFDTPTPGTANDGEAFLGILDPPAFSHEGGFYTDDFLLTASHGDPSVTLRYTLDGTEPTESSPVLDTALMISDRSGDPDLLAHIPTSSPSFWVPPLATGFKGTPVRVRAFKNEWIASKPTTRTFFVTEDPSDRYTLPVVSIVADPHDFFGEEHGIYVLGNNFNPGNYGVANFSRRGRNWERPVHLELFDETGEARFMQDAGARIHGGWTRRYPLKSLRLYARQSYSGDSAFEHELIPGATRRDGAPLAMYRRVVIRASGQDGWVSRGTLVRDMVMQQLVEHVDHIETQAGSPLVMFLNGEFWGISNFRERYDHHYISIRHDLDPGRVTILENNANLDVGDPEDSAAYIAMRQFAVENDLSSEQHFDHIVSLLDPESLAIYYIAQIYYNNTDWPDLNIRYWRYQADDDDRNSGDWWRDGRWRWMIFDTDYGFGLRGPARPAGPGSDMVDAFEEEFGSLDGVSANTLRWATLPITPRALDSWPNALILALLENEGFRSDFIRRFADKLNSSFHEDHVVQVITDAASEIAPVMGEHAMRWARFVSDGHWESNIQRLVNFAEQRPAHVRQHIVDYFDLEGIYELRIQMPPEGSARIRVNSIELEADGEEWTGVYFLGVPIEVEVLPGFGHEFLGWQGAFEGEGTLLTLNPGSDIALEPVVKEDAVTLHEVVLPLFMHGVSPDNNDRVPFSARLRIEGLMPNAAYRFANRVVTQDDSPTQNGAGNAIYFDAATGTHFRTTDTPDFSDPSTHGAFVTDGDGVHEGWFTIEPSGNARFGEPELFIRVLLNDGQGGEDYRHFLTTENSVLVLGFGTSWEEATGIYARTPLEPGSVVTLYDDIDGAGRPLTATLVADAGFETDDRYATFYEQFVTGQDGHFGALLPNLLPEGLRRIEAFDWFDGESTAVYTSQDGLWPESADTVNPDGGLGFPIALTLGPPTPEVFGDVNGDGVVNAVDVQLVINAALGVSIDPGYSPDINGDGVVNAVDVQLVINAALGIASAR